ncbi:class I SAM-dependent methyltransferase [Melittangium boletus]|uniref:class I SAM-dependent methyltransferase n=1 Tax=Melittangium boletus TaxID=83453 RepID=UPI001C54CBC5|nr:class I SAM-dependent methyltransferase [Melittangium boletus]
MSVAINQQQLHETVNEVEREVSLKALRQDNFRTILGHARRHAAPTARTLLEVGSAHGWFLETAAPHFDVLGIEPDETVGGKTLARGLPVRLGYFPEALRPDERFDIIIFNDVIEHIPDIRSAVKACHERLNPNGTLILNLPSSRGFFYRLSKILAQAGLHGPFDRMWQKDLPSPHIHYFNTDNLKALLESEGFDLTFSTELEAVKAAGLRERLSHVGHVNPLKLYFQYVGILGTLPFLRLLPSDIIVCIFRKRPA